MGIVKLALLVLAMVLSAAPLPFSDELGPRAMNAVFALATVFYLVASDYFQVVRLKGFIEFWEDLPVASLFRLTGNRNPQPGQDASVNNHVK